MMSRQLKVELFALFLYCAIIWRMDKDRGILTAAHVFRWYGDRCRAVGNWAYTQAIRADNITRELIEP
jgi:hypothetical protein